MRVPKGRSGSWFAEWEGESMPCIHRHWLNGTHYRDPGVGDHPAWPKFKEELRRQRRAILTTSHPPGPDGIPRRKDYIGIWSISQPVEGDGTIDFDLLDLVLRFKK